MYEAESTAEQEMTQPYRAYPPPLNDPGPFFFAWSLFLRNDGIRYCNAPKTCDDKYHYVAPRARVEGRKEGGQNLSQPDSSSAKIYIAA